MDVESMSSKKRDFMLKQLVKVKHEEAAARPGAPKEF